MTSIRAHRIVLDPDIYRLLDKPPLIDIVLFEYDLLIVPSSQDGVRSSLAHRVFTFEKYNGAPTIELRSKRRGDRLSLGDFETVYERTPIPAGRVLGCLAYRHANYTRI